MWSRWYFKIGLRCISLRSAVARDTNSTWGGGEGGGVFQVRIKVNWLNSGYTTSSAPVCVTHISSQWHRSPLFVGGCHLHQA